MTSSPNTFSKKLKNYWFILLVEGLRLISLSSFGRACLYSYIVIIRQSQYSYPYMQLDLPRYTERFGAISLHGVQRVYELDSGFNNGGLTSEFIRRIGNEEISEIERKMAIVIPIKGERLKLLEGVLSGIPHDCLTIIISNSPRQPVDRYKLEKEALEQFNRFVGRNALILHQKDPGLSEALRYVNYNSLFGPDDTIRNGKAEGMIIAMFNTPYTMVRISWIYKPKVSESGVYFSKWGRVSEITNQYLNSLISYYTGFETEIMRTGNSGEHCISLKLAELLTYSSGFSVEPYEIVNVLEEFGGIVPTENQEAMDKGIEVMQVETRNPHFHEEKGDIHLKEMIDGSLGCIYHSKICHPKLREKIVEELRGKGVIEENQEPSVLQKINPFKDIDMLQFGKILH